MVIIQENIDEGAELTEETYAWNDDEESDPNPTISLHAINGLTESSQQTMRIVGRYKRKPIHLLIDSGSTHNFLDLNIARGLGCNLQAIPSVSITVANG